MGEAKRKQKMQKASVVVLRHFGDVARESITATETFIVLARGVSPYALKPKSAGTYEVDVQSLPGGTEMALPMCIFRVPDAHVLAWQNMPKAAVTQMLDAIDAETAGPRQ